MHIRQDGQSVLPVFSRRFDMLSKLFGGIKMTWGKLIAFAVVSGLVTGVIALLVPDGNSIRQIAVTFEAWIVLAIIVVVNCEKPLEAACKTFVYFLVSQPLVYLVQVPFNRLGFGLFQYYWPYWAIWTVATFPGAYVAWYIKKDNYLSAVILSVALGGLIFFGTDYLRSTITSFPKFLLSTVFCFGMVPVLIFAILHKKPVRLLAAGIAAVILAASLFLTFRNGVKEPYRVGFGLDAAQYPITEGWTAELEDPSNGTVTISPGGEFFLPHCDVEIIDTDKPADIILKDPEGNTYRIPAIIQDTDNGRDIYY